MRRDGVRELPGGSSLIVLDTEGTELLKPDVSPLSDQPHLVEFAAVKLDGKLKEIDRLQFYAHPGIVLPATFTKITGITELMIKDAAPFIEHYLNLCEFFLGEREMVAHNLGYDEGILRFELMRIGKLLNFPWPTFHICTVEASVGIKGHRLSMSDLHLLAAGKVPEDRKALAVGDTVKHKSLGLAKIVDLKGDKVVADFDGKLKTLKAEMFKGAAFVGAHGAMKDVEELVTIVRYLRKEGHL
jgi:DNA polymerase III epsilon subunit-like protein